MKLLRQIGIQFGVTFVALALLFTLGAPALQRFEGHPAIQKAIYTLGFAGEAYAITPDYEVDGNADDVQVQQALNALPVTGGKLVLYAGNWHFNATVSRAINNVTIEGDGKGTYIANNAATAIFSAGAQTGWLFKDFRTDAGYLTLASDTRVEGVWNGTILVQSHSDATFVVAASNAPANEKAGANYICDGTADITEIQAALTAAGSSGTVRLTSGSFVDSANATITLTGAVSLIGAGAGAAFYESSTAYSTRIIRSGGGAGTMLTTTANYTGTLSGIYFDGGGTADYALQLLSPCGATFRDLNVYNTSANQYGVELYANSSSHPVLNYFENLFIHDVGKHGLLLYGYNDTHPVTLNTFVNIRIQAATSQTALYAQQYADHNTFVGGRIEAPETGTALAFGSSSTLYKGVYKNTFSDVAIDGQGAGPTQMIWAYASGMDASNNRAPNLLRGGAFGGSYTTVAVLDDKFAHVLLRDVTTFNPKGKITNPFTTFADTNCVGPFGTASAPSASQDYEVNGADIFLTSTGGAGVSITIKDPAGNTMLSGAATITTPMWLPYGYKINFGGFGGAPTVNVYAN